MWTKLTLFQRGIIIIALPLIFEIAFVVTVVELVKSVERDLLVEERSVTVMSYCHELVHVFFQAGSTLYLYNFSKDSKTFDQYKKLVDYISDELSTIEELIRGNTIEERYFEEVKRASSSVMTLMQALSNSFRQGQHSGPGDARVMAMSRLIEKVEAFTVHEQRNGQLLHERAERSAALVNTFLVAGFILNLGLGVTLVVYFTRVATNRLAIVSNNAKRLAAGSKLQPRVKGNDEIAALDRVFHEMDDALRSTEEQRRELMQMVSHDLRAPLTSIRVSFESLLYGILGTLPKEAESELRKCDRDALQVLSLVNDLTDMEALQSGKLDMDFQAVEINSLIRESVDSISDYEATKRVKLTIDYVSDDLVRVDSSRVSRVLSTLLALALERAYENTEVTLSCTHGAHGFLEIRIVHPGIPISEKDKPDESAVVSDSNAEDTRSRQTSLRIAICKATIELHGGTMGSAEVNEGSSAVWVTVPLAKKR